MLTNILESQKSVAKRVRKDFMVSTRILGVAFLGVAFLALHSWHLAQEFLLDSMKQQTRLVCQLHYYSSYEEIGKVIDHPG